MFYHYFYNNYRNSDKTILKSIDFKEHDSKNSHHKIKQRSLHISRKVVQFLKDNNLFDDFFKEKNKKIITVLGPLEDILGFFYNFEENKNSIYKKFFFLSVEEWTLDLNHDFITCSYPTKKNNFENMYSECPIILINEGNSNILNKFPILDQKIRVTHCEKTWINKLLNNNHYKWESFKIDKDIYVNILVKKK